MSCWRWLPPSQFVEGMSILREVKESLRTIADFIKDQKGHPLVEVIMNQLRLMHYEVWLEDKDQILKGAYAKLKEDELTANVRMHLAALKELVNEQRVKRPSARKRKYSLDG
ncbi:hypothetical protein Ciccas_006047 [Cichlidogyrus casuarinus]|uniref:Uncharacterized protein n=1 Tax=Cichlidogyrus casuarinus TaxID=1844966 RepID=A0ABD2Q6X8_9PLAT